MEARYALRKRQWLDACQMDPEIFEQVRPRLHTVMKPLARSFPGQAADHHATTSVWGRLSHVERPNIASSASRVGHSRLPLHRFLGWDAWDDAPWREAWRSPVKTPLGQSDGGVVFDPAGCPTSGRESVGVARPGGGRLGQVDTGPGALSLGSVSRHGPPLVAPRLSLPTAWTKDTARRDTAGVPNTSRASRTRHQWALERLEQTGAALPHRWMAGDDARGRPSGCRRRLAGWGEPSLWAVPANTSRRAREVERPASSARGRRPPRPWPHVAAGSPALDETAWHRLAGRDGRTGPLVVEAVQSRVVSRTPRRQQGAPETVVVLRYRDRDQAQVVKVDDDLSNAAPATPLGAWARVAQAAHRIEAWLQRSKSAAGWADDEGRHGTGWQQHPPLSFLATWFLVRETERGKKKDAGDHPPADSPGHCPDRVRGVAVRDALAEAEGVSAALATQCAGAFLSLETAQAIGSMECI
jgi:DDE superfamily endonuclease